MPKIVKRLRPILSAVVRLLEGDDEDASGGAVLVGGDEEEKPMEEGDGDNKIDGSGVVVAMKETSVDDDAIIIGPEAAPDKLTVDKPQVCGKTASFDAIVNSGVSLISELMEYSSSM